MSLPLKAILRRYLAAHGGADGVYETPVDGLLVLKSGSEALAHHTIYTPALCVTVQGAKRVMFGSSFFDYGEMQALVVSVALPGVGRATRASPGEPYLGLIVRLDPASLGDMMTQLGDAPQPDEDGTPGAFVIDLDGPLADCALRLARLLEMPQAATTILHSSILRELNYWLLTGPNGHAIRRLALAKGRVQRVAEAMNVLRTCFARPVRIEELAAASCMSPSSFHQHFKALTSMTPLQYQKQLRLIEARRLLVAQEATVTAVACRVGYESISHFSREYARMFGAPPRQDVLRLRRLAA